MKVTILKGLNGQPSKKSYPFEFYFTISGREVKSNSEFRMPYADEIKFSKNNINYSSDMSPVFQTDTIPQDFPHISVLRKYLKEELDKKEKGDPSEINKLYRSIEFWKMKRY